jgi:hypothetical protein
MADHWGVPEDAVTLELAMPAADPIGLTVIEHLLRPKELLGAEPFERPANLAPDITRRSDRAVFRFSVAAFADPRHAFMRPTGASPEVAPSAAADSLGMETSPTADTIVPSADTIPAPVDTGTTAPRDTLFRERGPLLHSPSIR